MFGINYISVRRLNRFWKKVKEYIDSKTGGDCGCTEIETEDIDSLFETE